MTATRRQIVAMLVRIANGGARQLLQQHIKQTTNDQMNVNASAINAKHIAAITTFSQSDLLCN